MSTFVIFAHPRSGSTSLAKVLDASPEVTLCFEPFHHEYSQWNPGERDYANFVVDKTTLHQALTEIFQTYNALKVQNYRLPEELFFEFLSQEYLKVLFLKRRNLFYAALSNAIAHRTNAWQKPANASVYDELPAIPPQEIEEWMQYVGNLSRTYLTFLQEHRPGEFLEVVYEDLFSDSLEENKQTIQAICEFVEVAMPSDEAIETFMLPKNAQINSQDAYKNVPNYKELEERFAHLQY